MWTDIPGGQSMPCIGSSGLYGIYRLAIKPIKMSGNPACMSCSSNKWWHKFYSVVCSKLDGFRQICKSFICDVSSLTSKQGRRKECKIGPAIWNKPQLLLRQGLWKYNALTINDKHTYRQTSRFSNFCCNTDGVRTTWYLVQLLSWDNSVYRFLNNIYIYDLFWIECGKFWAGHGRTAFER